MTRQAGPSWWPVMMGIVFWQTLNGHHSGHQETAIKGVNANNIAHFVI